MSNKLIYHAGTGTFFGADDDVYVIDLDSLVGEAREEVVYDYPHTTKLWERIVRVQSAWRWRRYTTLLWQKKSVFIVVAIVHKVT